MRSLKILRFFLNLIPDFVQIFFYKILYLMCPKRKFKKNIPILSKKNTATYNNLIIVDNMKALGDFFVSLNVIKNINNQNTKYKYTFVINKIYKDFIVKENFNNVNFIFLSSDFGTHYDRKKIEKKDIVKISNYISNQINEYKADWNNIFFCAFSLDLTHYSILSKINYNSAYYLKHFWTISKPRIVWQNIPIPSIPLWLYFFHFYKKMNLQIWNKKNKEIYYFGKMSYDMIKNFDNNLLEYTNDDKKIFTQNNNFFNISVMLKTSDKNKNINLNKFLKLLQNLNLNKNTNIFFLGKDYYEIPKIDGLNIFNLTGKTKNLSDLFNQIEKSQLAITADTSLYHISSYFGVPTIVLVNSKISKIDRIVNFWLENYNKNLVIKNKFFFKNKFPKKQKEFNRIMEIIKTFLNNIK